MNALTGKMEWVLREELYDYHQDVARSGYADMLHDSERNRKYYEGLKTAFAQLRANGSDIKVLDIGTGTGLLSMMAAKLGADDITACEAFSPIATCAKEVLTSNGYRNKVRLIAKRSTEITVGPDGDMPHRANVLVTEVFDTELIGEGAISTFNHAHKHLLEKHCLVIPSKAVVYVQLVQSKLIHGWHKPPTIQMTTDLPIVPPDDAVKCTGSGNVLDLQLSQLDGKDVQFLTDAHSIARFDFSCANPIPEHNVFLEELSVIFSGECHAILFWWDLEMDNKGPVVLSCAPSWIHPEGKLQPWRDHWLQAVYFPRNSIQCRKGECVTVQCSHDEYSFWFNTFSSTSNEECRVQPKLPRPQCTCGIHSVCNNVRLGMLNDSERNRKYEIVLRKIIKSGDICLFIGETSLLPLMAIRLAASKVYVVDDSSHSAKMLRSYALKNNMEERIIPIRKRAIDISAADIDDNHINLIMGEPYFTNSLLPWQNLHYWYALYSTRHLWNAETMFMPIVGELWGVAVHFKELWKIRAPLGYVEDFCLEQFDQIIQNSMNVVDASVEPHPLWEYESVALCEPFRLLSLNMTEEHPEDITGQDSISLLGLDSCNGVALWMEWHLDETTVVSQGPVTPVVPGELINWDLNSKQGVYFTSNNNSVHSVTYNAVFKVSTGGLILSFICK